MVVLRSVWLRINDCNKSIIIIIIIIIMYKVRFGKQSWVHSECACLDTSCGRACRAEILVGSSRRHLAATDDKRVHMTTCRSGCCLFTIDITQTSTCISVPSAIYILHPVVYNPHCHHPSLLHSFTPGAKPIPFHQILPTLIDLVYPLDCLHKNGTGLDLSRSSVYV